jgi:hypothetical protein
MLEPPTAWGFLGCSEVPGRVEPGGLARNKHDQGSFAPRISGCRLWMSGNHGGLQHNGRTRTGTDLRAARV